MTTIETCTNLHDLCDAINAMTRDERNDADLSDLPTFGGVEPTSTHNIWSWDETDVLVQAHDGFRVVPREEIL